MALRSTVMLLLAAATATAAPADTTGTGRPGPSVTAPADTASVEIPGLTVSAELLPWGDGPLPPDFLDRHDRGHLGEALEHLPGVAMVRRAPSGTEPVIRGLGHERVQTRFGVVPLHGACPGRMDPPVTYLGAGADAVVTASRHAAAGAGAGGPGGTIHVDPDPARARGAVASWTPHLAGGYESARSGYRAEGGVRGGRGALDLRAALGVRHLEDYDAPDGRTVPAGLDGRWADLGLGWRVADGHRLWTAWRGVHEEDIDYPALPMDNRATDFVAGNLGWQVRGERHRFDLTGGMSDVDHEMDNRDKANRRMVAAVTRSEARTWALRAELAAEHVFGGTITAGAEATRVHKDALRTRTILADSSVFRDHMWPDALQTTGGGWARLARPLAGRLRVSVEARVDAVTSEARAADDPSLGGLTVREQYVANYGPGAVETDVTETLGQGAVRLEGDAGGRATWHVRTGLAGRAAGITERYNAFGPAPGGFLVGNPTLRPEKTWQSEVGVDVGGGRVALGVAVFHARIADYVLPTVVDRRDVDGDGDDDVIKGFLNRDAVLTGGELALEYRPVPALLMPVSLACVRGRNTTDDRDLPEVPPLSGTAELRWRAEAASRTWVVAGARFAAEQERIDPLFGENRTGGWTVWHAGVESRPVAGLRVRVMVENLFDRLHNDHLTREAVLPTGGLARGDEIPAPGRSLEISARWDL